MIDQPFFSIFQLNHPKHGMLSKDIDHFDGSLFTFFLSPLDKDYTECHQLGSLWSSALPLSECCRHRAATDSGLMPRCANTRTQEHTRNLFDGLSVSLYRAFIDANTICLYYTYMPILSALYIDIY